MVADFRACVNGLNITLLWSCRAAAEKLMYCRVKVDVLQGNIIIKLYLIENKEVTLLV